MYCSRYPEPQAWRTDALSFPWTGLFTYVFPPISLLYRVLGKIEREQCRVLLIAPLWPRKPWFPSLLRLFYHVPLTLPPRPDLLRQPRSGLLHLNPGPLQLTCWPLSSVPSDRQAFLAMLPPLPPTAIADPLVPFTIANYDIFNDGVDNISWIRPQPL